MRAELISGGNAPKSSITVIAALLHKLALTKLAVTNWL
jgi:hypothetical protein